MATEFPLGIQSYCFRTYKTLDELIGALKAVGLEYVELWPGHQAPTADEAELQTTLRTLQANGITMNAFGQVVFKDDEPAARAALAFCRLAGVKAITANIIDDPAAIALAERLAEEYDVNLAIHNHGRKDRWGRTDQLDELFAKTSRRFGLCLDAAWMIDAGGDPVAAVDQYADRLMGVHLKDFSFNAEGNPVDVIVGEGNLDLPAFLRRLKAVGFDGYMSLEYEGQAEAPLPNVITCLEAIRAAMANV
ncbi:MAG: sugar phosphate isomerase/epimerase family protein [Planctomycetota bacterium]